MGVDDTEVKGVRKTRIFTREWEAANVTFMPLLSRAGYPALERRKGKEKASGKMGLLFHSLFPPIRTGVGDLFHIYFLPPQHFTLPWHYYFAKISLSIGSQYFQHSSVELHLWSLVLPHRCLLSLGRPFSSYLFPAILPD